MVAIVSASRQKPTEADGRRRAWSRLSQGQAVLVPRGVWHRLELREPRLLMAVTRRHGTRLATDPGSLP